MTKTARCIHEEFQKLNFLLGETSEAMELLVERQGPAIKLHFAKWTMHLCLVRQNDKGGACCGVRWAKYRIDERSRRSWYNGWLPGKVPSSIKQRMSEEGLQKFDVMNRIAKETMRLRKSLVQKKLRVIGTLQSVMETEESQVMEIVDFLRSEDSEESEEAAGSLAG